MADAALVPAPATTEAGRTLRLSDFVREMGLRKQALTEEIAGRILALFRTSVLATVGLTVVLAAIDATFIAQGIIAPAQRLVTERVLMAIIGASIVQVGAASLAIVYALFRQARGEDKEGSDGEADRGAARRQGES